MSYWDQAQTLLLSHLVLFPNEDVDTLVGSDASHAGTGSEESDMRHAPSIPRGGLRLVGTREE